MRAKTEAQVHAIHGGKFGVEIEMYGISRRRAIETVAVCLHTTGVDSDGHLQGLYVRDEQGRKWTVCSDSSIRTYDGETCELVTPILGYDDIETLQNIVRELRRRGAKSDPMHECGVHIHLDADQHTVRSLRAFANLISTHEKLLLKALDVNCRRQQWCRLIDQQFLTWLNNIKPNTMDEFRRVWYESQGQWASSSRDHYNATRYHLFNLHSLWEGKGIELRCFQFNNGLHAGELKAFIQLSLAMNEFAIMAPFAKRKVHQIQMDNPKYAMASFLSRLGMRGPEFETARKVLTRNLEGTARPRRRRPEPQQQEQTAESIDTTVDRFIDNLTVDDGTTVTVASQPDGVEVVSNDTMTQDGMYVTSAVASV